MIRWPRGRYNGSKIDGLKVSAHIHLLWWIWRPRVSWNFGNPYFIWLCISLRCEASYLPR